MKDILESILRVVYIQPQLASTSVVVPGTYNSTAFKWTCVLRYATNGRKIKKSLELNGGGEFFFLSLLSLCVTVGTTVVFRQNEPRVRLCRYEMQRASSEIEKSRATPQYKKSENCVTEEHCH